MPLASEFADLELLCFDVLFKTDKVRFFNIYRPPCTDPTSINYIDILIKCLTFHFAKRHSNVFVRDFNCPQINWNYPSCIVNDYVCKGVVNWIATSGLTQFVKFPTRQTNILDLVCVIMISLFAMLPLAHRSVIATTMLSISCS